MAYVCGERCVGGMFGTEPVCAPNICMAGSGMTPEGPCWCDSFLAPVEPSLADRETDLANAVPPDCDGHYSAFFAFSFLNTGT